MEEKLHGPAAPRKKENQKEKEGKGLRLRDSFSGSIWNFSLGPTFKDSLGGDVSGILKLSNKNGI